MRQPEVGRRRGGGREGARARTRHGDLTETKRGVGGGRSTANDSGEACGQRRIRRAKPGGVGGPKQNPLGGDAPWLREQWQRRWRGGGITGVAKRRWGTAAEKGATGFLWRGLLRERGEEGRARGVAKTLLLPEGGEDGRWGQLRPGGAAVRQHGTLA